MSDKRAKTEEAKDPCANGYMSRLQYPFSELIDHDLHPYVKRRGAHETDLRASRRAQCVERRISLYRPLYEDILVEFPPDLVRLVLDYDVMFVRQDVQRTWSGPIPRGTDGDQSVELSHGQMLHVCKKGHKTKLLRLVPDSAPLSFERHSLRSLPLYYRTSAGNLLHEYTDEKDEDIMSFRLLLRNKEGELIARRRVKSGSWHLFGEGRYVGLREVAYSLLDADAKFALVGTAPLPEFTREFMRSPTLLHIVGRRLIATSATTSSAKDASGADVSFITHRLRYVTLDGVESKKEWKNVPMPCIVSSTLPSAHILPGDLLLVLSESDIVILSTAQADFDSGASVVRSTIDFMNANSCQLGGFVGDRRVVLRSAYRQEDQDGTVKCGCYADVLDFKEGLIESGLEMNFPATLGVRYSFISLDRYWVLYEDKLECYRFVNQA